MISSDAYKRIVQKSCAQNEEQMSSLEKAIEQGDYEKIQFAAHALKGAYGNLRLGEIAQPVTEIDALARAEGDIETMKPLFVQMKKAMEELKTRIS